MLVVKRFDWVDALLGVDCAFDERGEREEDCAQVSDWTLTLTRLDSPMLVGCKLKSLIRQTNKKEVVCGAKNSHG